MKTKIVYKNEEFELPAIIRNQDEPLFLAKEVCKSLDLKNVSRALDGLDEDEKAKVTISNPCYDPKKNGSKKNVKMMSVTDVLSELKLQRNSLGKIRDEWKGVKKFNTIKGKQKLTIIKEPAMWRLVMRSKNWLAMETLTVSADCLINDC